MKKILIKHSVYLYCILNISLVLMIAIIYSLDEVPQQWAPAFVAIGVVFLIKGRVGLKELLSHVAFRKAHLKWNILALILPLVICGVVFLIISFIKYQELVSPTLNHSLRIYFLYLFLIILGSIGEEIGWRGFMLPMLLKKHSYLKSSVLIGIFWGVWHLRFQAGISVFFIYILLTIELSIIISWLYQKTNGNIMSAIIIHSSFNLCALLLFEEIVVNISQNSELIEILYLSLVGLFLPLCIYIVILMNRNMSN